MRKAISIIRVVVSLCVVVASGCSLNPTIKLLHTASSDFPSEKSKTPPANGEQLIAQDLVSALVQIDDMNPAQVSLSMDDLSSSFDVHVQSALSSAGYRRKSEAPSLQSLSVVTAIRPASGLTLVSSEATETLVSTYQIKIRNILLRRDYLFDNGRIEPRSRMHIKGVNTIRVKLDSSIFDTYVMHHAEAEQHSTIRPRLAVGKVAHTAVRPDLSTAVANPQLSDVWSDLGSSRSLVVRTEAEVGSSLSVGDPVRIIIEAGQNSWVHCYYEDSAGTVTRVFPNRFRKDSTIHAGEPLVLPQSNRWLLSAPLKGETEHVMCIAIPTDDNEGIETKPLLPDLLPIVSADLGDIRTRYEAAAGASLVNSMVSIAVH